MKYNGLTNTGRAYLAKMQATNTPIKFAKIKFGNGALQEHENPGNFTDIKNIKSEKSILEIIQNEDAVKLKTQLDNVGLNDGYFPRETGIYVLDGSREILYYYINDGDETSYLPPESNGPVRFDITINLVATSESVVTVNNDGKDLYITKDFFDKELAKKENAIIKKSGFNLEKTDNYTENNTNKLGTSAALYKLYGWVKDTFTMSWDRITGKPNLTSTEDLDRLLSGKEQVFSKNTAFNKNFGTSSGTVLEGDKYDIIKSIPGTKNNIGFIQNAGQKIQGEFYLDSQTGKLYRCIKSTQSTINSTEFFQDVSLGQISDRLNNLCSFQSKVNYYSDSEVDLSADIITTIGKLCIITLTINNKRKRTDTVYIKYPISFIKPPYTVITDNDGNKPIDSSVIGYDWPSVDGVSVTGVSGSATMLILGYIN